MTASTNISLAPGEGRTADLPNLGNRFMIDSAATDGRFALIEHTIQPRRLAAPMHVHEREDEYSFVLSGRMGAQIGDDVVEAGPGELVFKPRGIWHAFWSACDEETRLLELISPGDFSEYFAELAPLLSAAAPDFAKLAEVQARYALTMDMDSIGPLMEQHGLRP
jgi:mannose-6-phosphate isomerase-like protein (cupin superfamily)